MNLTNGKERPTIYDTTHDSLPDVGIMTIVIILGIWFACSLIASPLIGWVLFTLGQKNDPKPLRPTANQRLQPSFGRTIKFFVQQRHKTKSAPQMLRRTRRRV